MTKEKHFKGNKRKWKERKNEKVLWNDIPFYFGTTKNPIKDWWPEPSKRRQKGKAKKKPKDAKLAGTKKKGER